MGDLTKNFSQYEFECNHCGEIHPTNPTPPAQVLNWLEMLRKHFGDQPVHVNSGYRCPTHNANVGGAKRSLHLEGQAVDFTIKGVDPQEVYEAASMLIDDDGGVGDYDNFTHIDNRGYKARW